MKKKPNGYWTDKRIQDEAYLYQTRGTFLEDSPSAYRTALARGILDQVCAHMRPSLREPYTNEELAIEALRYNTRKNFQEGNSAAYQAAWKRNILDQICSHMAIDLKIGGIPHNYFWTEEKIQLEANRYATRGEFQKGSKAAYQAAVENGLLDKVCCHMIILGGVSVAEMYLCDVIKCIYPHARKFRDRKVRIEGKSHIKGFDIDILVGKLGIEFDGKYHHTFEYMRKDKRKIKWSDEEIRNYHQIKDAWFTAKGIQILHVKEEDWNLDKEICIIRCLNFLSVEALVA